MQIRESYPAILIYFKILTVDHSSSFEFIVCTQFIQFHFLHSFIIRLDVGSCRNPPRLYNFMLVSSCHGNPFSIFVFGYPIWTIKAIRAIEFAESVYDLLKWGLRWLLWYWALLSWVSIEWHSTCQTFLFLSPWGALIKKSTRMCLPRWKMRFLIYSRMWTDFIMSPFSSSGQLTFHIYEP